MIEIVQYNLDVRNIIYNTLAEQLTDKQVQRYFEFQDNLLWVRYAIICIVLLIKTIVIAAILDIGIFFAFKNKPIIGFIQLWVFVINAEFVFLLTGILKICWFFFFQTNYKLEDIINFYPLSALNIVGYKDLNNWFIYPLQTINLFELAYCLILSYSISKAIKVTMDKGFIIVVSSYGLSLLIWVVAVMFFNLNMN